MSAVARRYYERGTMSLQQGDLENAQEALRAAIDLAPGFNDARIAYSLALARAGDCPRAASGLARVYARTARLPQMVQALRTAARGSAAAGAPTPADAAAGPSSSSSPSSAPPRTA